jgi:uncharacterized protein (TIGR03067 family)
VPRHLILLVSALLAAVVTGAPKPKDPPKSAPSVVGKWLAIERRTRTASEETDGLTVEFTADGKFVASQGKAGGATGYTADPAKQPAELDFTYTGASPRRCIYKLEDDGTLVICYPVERSGGRPTKFELSDDTTALMKLKRAEKKE